MSAGTGRVMVGLSGGVDSAVAALLLQQQGWEVEALFMKNWDEDDTAGHCSAAEDLADAQAVADRLGIVLHTVNFSAEYWDQVFSHFLAEYRAGRTPNPDVLCNREIKFHAFLEFAQQLGAEKIATGHYAKKVSNGAHLQLRLSADQEKDQTYFLYMLNQRQLSSALFPLGDLGKPEVRALAQQAGFANHQKKDSTGICFIGERHFRQFLQRYLPTTPGAIVTTEGAVIGQHQGAIYYTLGQRKGLGIGGVKGATEGSWFVIGKDTDKNTLTVAQDPNHPELMKGGLIAESLHWVKGTLDVDIPFQCTMRLRHRQPLFPCRVVALSADRMELRFAQPQRAVTPGQAAVLYDGETCLGGGTIVASAP